MFQDELLLRYYAAFQLRNLLAFDLVRNPPARYPRTTQRIVKAGALQVMQKHRGFVLDASSHHHDTLLPSSSLRTRRRQPTGVTQETESSRGMTTAAALNVSNERKLETGSGCVSSLPLGVSCCSSQQKVEGTDLLIQLRSGKRC